MKQLEEFLKKNAEDSGSAARLLLGYYYTKNSDYNGAIEEFTKLIDSADEPVKTRIGSYLHRGNANLSVLDFDSAVADYKAALKLKPGVKDKLIIARQLSKAYIRSNKQKEAIALWEQIVAENPDKQDLQEDLIELYIEEELYTESLKITDALLKKTDDSYDRVMRTLRKGDIYQFSGKDPNAIELYSETLSSVGRGTWLEREILAQISRVFMREENKSGLEKHFADLITKYPSRISLIRKYSQILADNGKYDEAIETYKKVLKLAPGDRDVAWQFVRLLTDANRKDEATKAMESLVSQYKSDLELRLSLAELYNTAKKRKLAVKTVESYLADSDKSEYAYSRVGMLYEKFKSKEKADQLYEDMAKAFPDSIGAKEVFAAYLNRTERTEEAVKIWKTLAENGELELVLRTCKTLKSNKFAQTALDIIVARFDEFKDDVVFLSNAVDIASGLKRHDLAISWAMDMTVKSENSGQLENAITKTKAVIKYAKKVKDVIADLEKNEQLIVQQNCLLAEFYNDMGNYDKATEILNAADGQNEGLLLSQRIRLCSQNHKWYEAAQMAERLFATAGGSNSRNAKKLVDLYRRSLQTTKAIKWVSRWKELAPGSTMPWIVHCDILHADGKNTEAINTLRIAVRKFDSNNEELLNKLALYYTDANKYADAIRIYWKMYGNCESVSDKLSMVERLSNVARIAGTLSALTEQFKQRKERDRTSVLPRLALARIYNRSENHELRRRELVEVSRLKPDDITILYEIANMEEVTGRWQDAVATLKRASELDETSKTDHKIARLHMEYGNEEQGIKMLLDLAGGYDVEPLQAAPLAEMLIMQGYPEMAVKYLEEII
jgi:tetratricopeptide (TPR) repeat protein